MAASASASACRVLGGGVTRTRALRSDDVAGLIRGLTVPDVKASLADARDPESTVSNSTMGRRQPRQAHPRQRPNLVSAVVPPVGRAGLAGRDVCC